jgi:hypothetical protein
MMEVPRDVPRFDHGKDQSSDPFVFADNFQVSMVWGAHWYYFQLQAQGGVGGVTA